MQTSPANETWCATAGAMLTALEELGRLFRDKFVRNEVEGGMVYLMRTLRRIGPARVTELASETRLDTSTVSRHVQNLERRGYIARTPDPDDRRAQRLELSEQGQTVIRSMLAGSVTALHGVMGDWTDSELTQFSGYLTRLVQDLHATDPR